MELRNIAPFLKAAADRADKVSKLFATLAEARERAAKAQAVFDSNHDEKDLREAARLRAEVAGLADRLNVERRRAVDENLDAWKALAADFAALHKELASVAASRQKELAAASSEFIHAGGNFFIIPTSYEKELYGKYDALRSAFISLGELHRNHREAALSQGQCAEVAAGHTGNSREFRNYLARAQGLANALATAVR
jgi:hypothetical protein